MTIAIVLLFSKISKAIPASSLYYCRVWSSFRLGIETKTVADIASISGGFPPFHIRIFL
jgi:SulP family sulfate permease